MDAASKHSSSAATASLCLSHIQELWVRLAWPDPAQAQGLGTQLSQVHGLGLRGLDQEMGWGQGLKLPAHLPPQDMCEAALFYTELLRKKVDTQPGAAGEAVSEQVRGWVSGEATRWLDAPPHGPLP